MPYAALSIERSACTVLGLLVRAQEEASSHTRGRPIRTEPCMSGLPSARLGAHSTQKARGARPGNVSLPSSPPFSKLGVAFADACFSSDLSSHRHIRARRRRKPRLGAACAIASAAHKRCSSRRAAPRALFHAQSVSARRWAGPRWCVRAPCLRASTRI